MKTTRAAFAAASLVFVFAGSAAALPITLSKADPDHLVVDSAGKPQTVVVYGTNFEAEGHPDRDQYMHWQIRRDDGGWQRCGKGTPDCNNPSFASDHERFAISGRFLQRPGFIELRVFRGLGESDITDPSQAANLASGGWSSVLRIPVRAAPPVAAPPAPTRTPTPKPTPTKKPILVGNPGVAGSAGNAGGIQAQPQGQAQLQKAPTPVPGTCLPGFVWRQAIPADHVCVPPDHRTLAARQNAEAAAHKLPNGGPAGPDTCRPGFVWRDAFANDHVCVTPAERAQAAEDNRAGPSHTVK